MEIVRRSYETFQSGDLEAAVEFAHPEFEFVSRFGAMHGRTYKGLAGVRDYLADIAETWHRYERELEELIDAGDAVVAILTITAVSRATEIPITQRIGMVYWLRDRRIARLVSYPSVEEALEAVR